MTKDKIIKEPICFSCKHYLFFPFCMAFLDGWPKSVRMGENDHKKPIKGDQGLQYEPYVKSEMDAEIKAMEAKLEAMDVEPETEE